MHPYFQITAFSFKLCDHTYTCNSCINLQPWLRAFPPLIPLKGYCTILLCEWEGGVALYQCYFFVTTNLPFFRYFFSSLTQMFIYKDLVCLLMLGLFFFKMLSVEDFMPNPNLFCCNLNSILLSTAKVGRFYSVLLYLCL